MVADRNDLKGCYNFRIPCESSKHFTISFPSWQLYLVGWLVGRLVGWLIGWLVGWLVGSFVGCCRVGAVLLFEFGYRRDPLRLLPLNYPATAHWLVKGNIATATAIVTVTEPTYKKDFRTLQFFPKKEKKDERITRNGINNSLMLITTSHLCHSNPLKLALVSFQNTREKDEHEDEDEDEDEDEEEEEEEEEGSHGLRTKACQGNIRIVHLYLLRSHSFVRSRNNFQTIFGHVIISNHLAERRNGSEMAANCLGKKRTGVQEEEKEKMCMIKTSLHLTRVWKNWDHIDTIT
ncbi:hypothetical protein V1478_005208 [Vespula squamosa]|uniref:Uncharacterized protein n=1 Tax=Vespula squamosa TaxID=30214 RepID=A0ABD2BDP0_VESSQ